MSDERLKGTNSGPDVSPSCERSAESKRLAARRWFLSRGAAGAGLVVVTMIHRRADAQSPTKVLLSIDFGNADAPASQQAIAACQSLAPGSTPQAGPTVDTQSFFNPNPGFTVWYCGPPG